MENKILNIFLCLTYVRDEFKKNKILCESFPNLKPEDEIIR